MTRATPALQRALTSRAPLELTEQELAAKVDELRKRHPKLAIDFVEHPETMPDGDPCRLGAHINVSSRLWVFMGHTKRLETQALTRGEVFKDLVRACQVVEEPK